MRYEATLQSQPLTSASVKVPSKAFCDSTFREPAHVTRFPVSNTEHSVILSIYKSALSLDFALQKQAGESHIMPLQVIKHLCDQLDADGGNFTIYHCDDDYLEVRAWYARNPVLDFPAFKAKFTIIARDPVLRTQSSSYRCIDQKRNILIPISSTDDVDRMTLDVSTLTLKSDLSAVAVPFIYHGQIMGVLNMDINNSARKAFNQDDSHFLQELSLLLPPILHNSLTVETITKINDLILNRSSEEDDGTVLASVCKLICDFLFVPWAGVFLRHEAIGNLISLVGYNGHLLTGTDIEKLQRINLTTLGESINNVITKKLQYIKVDINRCFPFLHLERIINCRALRLADKSELIDGFLLLISTDDNDSESFQRLCQFIADFTSLTLGALKQFDFRSRDTYEIAAHELKRNLSNLGNTQARLERTYKIIDRQSRMQCVLDDQIMHEFKTIQESGQGHLEKANQTLSNLLDTPRVASKSIFGRDDDYSEPILKEAKHRQHLFNLAEKKPTVNLRHEINEICNSFTRVMTRKNVNWDRSKFGPLPRLIDLDRHNFHTIFSNLVDNAVKYSKSNTNIKLISDFQELQIVLMLTNVGPLIDAQGAEKSDIFVRRYRGLAATKMAPGKGLGLWQARAVARLWGGDPLRLAFCEPLSRDPGDGQQWASVGFRLEIPVIDPEHIVRG